MIVEDRPDCIERLVREAEDNGQLVDAMRLHERLLLVLQRYHRDPSEPVDLQKVRLCEAILRVEAAEEQFQVETIGEVVVSSNHHSQQTLVGSQVFSSSFAATTASRVFPYPQRRSRSAEKQQKRRLKTRASGAAVAAARLAKSQEDSAPARHAPLLTESLSLQGLLAFGDRLLSDGNILPASQQMPRLIRARAEILQSLATLLYKQGRPRAGVPYAQGALARFEQLLLPPNYISVEVVRSFLALCTMLSASERHREALLCIVLALRMTDALEQAYIANKPAVNGQDAESPSTCAAVTATSGGDNSNASRTNEEGVSLEPAESAVPQSVARRTDEEREGAAPLDVRQSSALLFSYPPARREFVGSLEAACFHNAAVELERLGLHEMALVCYRSGHELARHSLGEQHPLTAKLQQNIEELFLAVNYKHFLPDGRRPGDRCTAFDDPDRALRQLNFTYYASSRHRDALLRDNAKAKMLLQQAADPRSPMSSSVAPSSTLQHRRVTSALKI